MNEPLPEDDPVLRAAGTRLRAEVDGISPGVVQVAVLRRRNRILTAVAGVAVVATAALGAYAVRDTSSGGGGRDAAAGTSGAATADAADPAEVEAILAALPARPQDPTKVKLVSTVSSFDGCGPLVDDLRRVGAAHVGSQGFGVYNQFRPVGYAVSDEARSASSFSSDESLAPLGAPNATTATGADKTAAGSEGTTLGTNVQVEGVDELDSVKAVGTLIYDLDGQGNLRITDAAAGTVLGTVDVTPALDKAARDKGTPDPQVSQILVDGTRVVVFGSETEISDPVEGDPSATQASTDFMTVTFVDAKDAKAPKVTDRVRIEGRLVAARLVGGQVRLVTTANMADLGFVMPTTPNSVPKALEANRRSVAGSGAGDWIPDWQRTGEDAQPLVPCDRVHVPDTFSGVAMTSMVTFPVADGRFEPNGTSILAPADTLYAGLDKVAVSSEVWVDPIDRDRLKFDDWKTAVHEFSFDGSSAPSYDGSGIVEGSTVGQFAFGELGTSLAVVTTTGTPWSQNTENGVDLTVLTTDGKGGLARTAGVDDIAGGKGAVTAVRFVTDRVLVSTGFAGRQVRVIDVTDPATPRRAGSVTLPVDVGYFHPLPDHQALLIGSRSDTVGTGDDKQSRSWVQADLLDVSDADAPKVVSTWERPWSADGVAGDHHTFTYWPDRKLAMWGIQNTQYDNNGPTGPNHAAVLSTDGTLKEVAVPVANKPNETPPPCATVQVPADAQNMVGPGDVILRCDAEIASTAWPRYSCSSVSDEMVSQYAPDQAGKGKIYLCNKLGDPSVARVLVVAGTPYLYTDQTLERLDPTTFASTNIAYHPTSLMLSYMY